MKHDDSLSMYDKVCDLHNKNDGYRSDGYGFINESNLKFDDISSEEYRIYEFESGKLVRINCPLKLNVSPSGGHRLYDAEGNSHYIPKGWIHLKWRAKEGRPSFVK